jgi:hypothetical protein
MGMQLKRGPEPKPQEPQGPSGSFLGALAETPCGILVLLFFMVVLLWACMAMGLAGTGNPPF